MCHHPKVSARSNLLIAFMNLQRVTWLALSISLLASSPSALRSPPCLPFLYHPLGIVPVSAPSGKRLLNVLHKQRLKTWLRFPWDAREWRETVIDLSYGRVNYQHIRAGGTTLPACLPTPTPTTLPPAFFLPCTRISSVYLARDRTDRQTDGPPSFFNAFQVLLASENRFALKQWKSN